MARLTVTLSDLVAGRPPEGAYLRVTSPNVVDQGEGRVLAGGLRDVPIPSSGVLVVDLVATDAPLTNPLPGTWVYGLQVRWNGGHLPRVYTPILTGEDVNLADLLDIGPVDPAYRLPLPIRLDDVDGLVSDLDARTTATQVEDIVDDLAPGTELAFLELPATYQTTQTNITSVVPGMTVTVVGTGRPVEIEFYAPSVTHSAGGDIVGWVFANSAPFSRWSQVSTAKHGSALVVRERIVIPVGFQVTFGLYVYADTPGTATVSVTDFIRPHLSVVAR